MADDRGIPPLSTARFQPLLLPAHWPRSLGDSVTRTRPRSWSPRPCIRCSWPRTSPRWTRMTGGRPGGIGLGWMPNEFAAFGIDKAPGRADRGAGYPGADPADPGRRGLRMGALPVRNAPWFARSVQPPVPPLWIGASAGPAVRRAARIGDAWTMSAHLSINDLRQHLAVYQAELDRLGNPIRRATNHPHHLPGRGPEAAIEEVVLALVDGHRKRGDWAVLKQGEGMSDEAFADGRWIIYYRRLHRPDPDAEPDAGRQPHHVQPVPRPWRRSGTAAAHHPAAGPGGPAGVPRHGPRDLHGGIVARSRPSKPGQLLVLSQRRP